MNADEPLLNIASADDGGSDLAVLPRKGPSALFVHALLGSYAIIVGFSTVIIKLGLGQVNPVLFALLRDATSAPILCTIAYALRRHYRDLRNTMT